MNQQQDDYFYEIQLTNKQLVFYFLAGALGLVLSFLAGVMVGRGVEGGAAESQAAKPVQEERIVPEEPAARPSPPAAEELTYAQRLEGERPDEALDRAKPAAKAAPSAKPTPAQEAAKPEPTPAVEKKPAAAKPPPAAKKAAAAKEAPAAASPAPEAAASTPGASPSPKAARAEKGSKAKPSPSPKPAATGSAIQVGAFKDKETAESVVARLKKKGFAAYVATPSGTGLFNVRVGPFAARADAERALLKLRDEEKFKPFIVKN